MLCLISIHLLKDEYPSSNEAQAFHVQSHCLTLIKTRHMFNTIKLCGYSEKKKQEGLKVDSREIHLPWSTISLRPSLFVLSDYIYSVNNLRSY